MKIDPLIKISSKLKIIFLIVQFRIFQLSRLFDQNLKNQTKLTFGLVDHHFNFWPQVGARALAALQQGVDPLGMNQQQFLVYPTVGGIPMIISTDPAQQALTKV